MPLTCQVIASLEQVPAKAWDRLNKHNNPFLSHAFLSSFEQSRCVHSSTGWQPQHLICSRNDAIVGALPLYLKSHSYGEFVFDWSWAEAYARSNREYYPKLVSAVPFTPVTGPRLLVANNDAEIQQCLQQAAIQLAERLKASSIHVLFSDQKEASHWHEQGFLVRTDCQFHWKNTHYRDFDDFIGTFTAKRRKEARRERRIANQGVEIKMFRGYQITPEHWTAAFGFYQNHAQEKGGMAYLNQACFNQWAKHCADNTLIFFAYQENKMIAGAFFILGEDALYGRYWGANRYHPCLHFELCYYRPIEYCIAHGIDRFEAGAQGEHKLGRGLIPKTTYSAHWIAHPEFRQAISNYLGHEKQGVEHYMQHANTLTPQRKRIS